MPTQMDSQRARYFAYGGGTGSTIRDKNDIELLVWIIYGIATK